MNLSFFGIVISLIITIFLLLSIKSAFLGKRNFFRSIIEITIWLFLLTFSIFPEVAHSVSNFFGFGNNLNTLIFIGFILIFVIVFRLYKMNENLNENITNLVRELALRNIKK